MKRITLLLSILGIWLQYAANAQSYFNKRETLHSFASRTNAVLESIGRLFTASTCLDSVNDLGNGFLLNVIGLRLTKWDNRGNIIHDTVCQRIGLQLFTESNSLLELPDKSILIPASGYDTGGSAKLVLCCFDTSGNFKWLKKYDKPFCIGLVDDYWKLNDFKSDGHGGWLMLSTIKCVPTGTPPSIALVLLTKLDSSFNVIWYKDYGDYNFASTGNRLIIEPWGYTIGGGYSNDNRVNVGFKYHAEIFKTDTAGNQIWQWRSPSNKTGRMQDLIHTSDGGYVYCGHGAAYEIVYTYFSASMMWRNWVEKIDSNGQVLWNTTLNDSLVTNIETNQQVALKELPDGSIMVAGQVLGKWDQSDTEATRNFGALTKLSSNGHVLWQRKYVANSDSFNHYIYDMKRTTDGGYVMAGYADDVYHQFNLPRQRAWLIKVDSNGCQSNNDPQCWPLAVTPTNIKPAVYYSVYPNPASNQLYIQYKNSTEQATMLILYDVAGKAVLSKLLNGKSGSLAIDVSSCSTGVYFYRVVDNGSMVSAGKVIKQ